jgi:hypothetical protein
MILRTLTALAVGAAGVLAFCSAPATAAPAVSCDGALVFWDSVGYKGSNGCLGYWQDTANLSGFNMQDRISSVQNFTGTPFCLYADNNYSGDRFQIEPYTSIVDMRVPNSYWNDRISSIKHGGC